jgi:CRP-like cAMP-binding protein
MVDKEKLAGLELFEGLPDPALGAIAAISEELSYAPQAVIFSPEVASNLVYLLLEGTVRLTVFSSPLPGPVPIAVLETPGQAFGFSVVVGQGHHNTSAEAVTKVKVVAIDGPLFLDYLEKDPETGFKVMRRVARVISRRLAAVRRLLLQTIIDYEAQASATPEN